MKAWLCLKPLTPEGQGTEMPHVITPLCVQVLLGFRVISEEFRQLI